MQVDIKHALIGQLYEANYLQGAQIQQMQHDLMAANGAKAVLEGEVEDLRKPKTMPEVVAGPSSDDEQGD